MCAEHYFIPVVSQNIILNIELQVFSSMICITRRMAQDESGAMEQHVRLAMFPNQGFHRAVQEHPRRPRDARNQTVLESSVRCETELSMELRASQVKHESTMEMKEQEIIFRIGTEAQATRRHQRAQMLTEHNQHVLGGDPKIQGVSLE